VTPFGWWATNKWLQNFAYRIDIGWWVFSLAGALAIIIALLTVSFHAIKAAVANPVNSYEPNKPILCLETILKPPGVT
jgi:putative ABC transport system permease protein